MTIIPEVIQQKLLELVRWRVECIRDGKQAELDDTYASSCLRMQNKYNIQDYRWYRNLIESGFGEDTQHIDMQCVDSLATLPFAGVITYAWKPEFAVYVQTVSGRRTLWLVRMVDGEPKVVLPTFGGRTADSVATGEWRLPNRAEPESATVTLTEFHPHHFAAAVAESAAQRLNTWSLRLKFETLRAAAITCAPWFGQCGIALLTTQEDFPEAEFGKWAIGNWRWGDLEELDAELCRLISSYYQGETLTDREQSGEFRVDVIFRALAIALQSDEVAAALTRFQRTADFELGVFNPDDSREGNFCERNR